MKKKLLTLGFGLLFCTACEVTVTDTTDNGDIGNVNEPQETFKAGDIQKTRNLPTEYYIKDVMAYTWSNGAEQATIYSSTCKEEDYKLVWKPDNKQEYVVTFFEYPSRDSIEIMIGAASFGMFYDPDLANPYPTGLLYQADQVDKASINGFVIGTDTYANVGFINTDCLVDDLDFADEILNFLEINERDRVVYSCNSVNAAGVEIKLTSNKPTSVSYNLSYEGIKCDVTEKLRFAYYEDDCQAAYDDFLIDAEKDPTLKFDMTDYSYALSTSDIECIDDLMDEFYMNAPLLKSQNVKKKTGKDFAKLLASMSKKIRK